MVLARSIPDQNMLVASDSNTRLHAKRILTSPGGNSALELACLFRQLAGDGLRLTLLSLLGGKALCNGEGIHVQRQPKRSARSPHTRSQSTK